MYFFGTGEISTNLKAEDLFDYVENKTKFIVDKNLKRKFYKEAVDQIEAALLGEEDVTAINTPPLDASAVEEAETTIDSTADESMAAKTDSSVTTINASTVEKNEEDDKEEVSSPENAKKSAPPQKARDKEQPKVVSPPGNVSPVKKDQNDSASEAPALSAGEGEVVSRSGRKIKPKRYLVDEMEETAPTPKRKTTTEKEPDISITQAPVVVSTPVSTKSTSEKDKILELESSLLELEHLIKSSVGLNGAQPDKCIEHLSEFKKLKITALMLKKHPNCVETMKRLRRYVGNVKAWEMNDTLRSDFEDKAQVIRVHAEEIYSSFKKLFNFNTESQPFYDFFMVKLKEFTELTSHMTQEEVQELIVEPLQGNTAATTENNSQ